MALTDLIGPAPAGIRGAVAVAAERAGRGERIQGPQPQADSGSRAEAGSPLRRGADPSERWRLAVLHAVARAPEGLAPAELPRRWPLTRPLARRIAAALVAEGLLAREGTGRPCTPLRFSLTDAGRKALQAGQAGISLQPAPEPPLPEL